jgi:hypothetical protein
LSDARADVLRFWRAVELFNPQSVPKIRPGKYVEDVRETGLLPWEAGHPLGNIELRDSQVWRRTVYGGLFDLEKVRNLLEGAFGKDPESSALAPRAASSGDRSSRSARISSCPRPVLMRDQVPRW